MSKTMGDGQVECARERCRRVWYCTPIAHLDCDALDVAVNGSALTQLC
jgi:hypothetical protein